MFAIQYCLLTDARARSVSADPASNSIVTTIDHTKVSYHLRAHHGICVGFQTNDAPILEPGAEMESNALGPGDPDEFTIMTGLVGTDERSKQ